MIAACQPGTLPRSDNHGPEATTIAAVTLEQDFPIRADRSSEFIQDGKIRFFEGVSEYDPHCKLELRAIADTKRVIRPETFTVRRIYRQEDFVGYRRMIVAGDGDSGQIMSTTYLFLQSGKQPDIFRLSCMRLDQAFYARHVTVQEMRDTLGDLVTLSLPGTE